MIIKFALIVFVFELVQLTLFRYLVIPFLDFKINAVNITENSRNRLTSCRNYIIDQLHIVEIYKKLLTGFMFFVGGYYCSFLFMEDPLLGFTVIGFAKDAFSFFALLTAMELAKHTLYTEIERTVGVQAASFLIFLLIILVAYWSNNDLWTILSVAVALKEATDYISHLC